MKRWYAVPTLVVALLLPASPASATAGETGYDVSHPQCSGSAMAATPPGTPAFGVVGVNNGIAWSTNPCLQAEATWAAGLPTAPMLYANGANPGPQSSHWPASGTTSPAPCADASNINDAGCAYDYGWATAGDALVRAQAQTAISPTSVVWWLDVELANSWDGDGISDTASIQGMVDALRVQGVPEVGIYSNPGNASTPSQWSAITGSAALGTPAYTRSTASTYRAHWPFAPRYPLEDGPVWFAGLGAGSDAPSRCALTSFTGGERLLAQYKVSDTQDWDGDYRCADRDLTAPSAAMTAPTSVVTTASKVTVGWKGTDSGSGVASFDGQAVRAPYNGPFGAWSTFGTRLLTSSASLASPSRGWTTCWHVRARDAAGNVSGWSANRCTTTPFDDRELSAGSGWTRRTGASGWFTGSYSSATKLGSTLTRTGVQTSRLVLLAYRCPTCGSVSVFLNSTKLKTVSLASSTSGRVQVALPRFSLRTTKVTLRVATSGKLVRIDGLATSRV